MSTRILVNSPITPLGQSLLEATDLVARAQESVSRINGAVTRMTSGTPADYAAVQTELGIATIQAAEDLVFLLQSATGAINAAILTEFVQRTEQGG